MEKRFNNIDQKLSSGGPETPPLDMQQFIKLADKEKYEFEALNEQLELLREKWLKERQPGETFQSWFNRTPTDEIIKLSMKDGGVVDLAKYRKSKEPAKVKKINLSDFFDMGRTVASLSQSERETLGWLLNKTFNRDK
jgi:hypothetical protein